MSANASAGWTPESYPGLDPVDAAKVASSAIAPLVAASAGLFSITEKNLDDGAAALRVGMTKQDASKPDKRHASWKQLKASLPAMAMPWFRMDEVAHAAAHDKIGAGVEPQPTFGQWRPQRPAAGFGKYMMVGGGDTVLGVHPSTPSSYFRDMTSIMICEGQLKALSALTAWLLDRGVSFKDLSEYDPSGSRNRLRDIMDTLADKLLIISMVGVGNWHGKPEWESLSFKNKPVYVAFDGDVASNVNVWKQADRLQSFLESKKALRVAFLDPSLDDVDKAGVDDYFAGGKTWNDLIDTELAELPDAPDAGEEFLPGTLRVNETDCVVEEFHVDVDGATTIKKWVPKYPMSGRLVSIDTPKYAAWGDDELATGKLNEAYVDTSIKDEVVYEISWKNADGQKSTGSVTGPSDLLTEPPDRWHMRGGKVPVSVSRCPDWTAMDKKWQAAIKRHRSPDTINRYVWNHMGWVPTSSGRPVFIAGNDVLGAEGPLGAESDTVAGVTSAMIPGTSSFGLNLVPASNDEHYQQLVRAAIEEVISVYTGGVWGKQSVAALTIAAAIRPVVPIRPISSILLAGPPRGGKSWTAKAMMAFWQHEPGAFQSQLPGSASDTKYSMEDVVARTPIWVADDQAPSVDARKAEREEAGIGAIIRSIFNGTGTRRMFSDGTRRQLNQPRCVFVVTAENSLVSHSEMDRVVHINTGERNFLGGRDKTGELERLNMDTLAANHIVAACVQMLAVEASYDGWSGVIRAWKQRLKQCQNDAGRWMAGESDDKGKATRHSEIAADLMLGLEVLRDLAEQVEVSIETLDKIEELSGDLIDVVNSNFQAQTHSIPGRKLMESLQDGLSAGHFHILGAQGMPPMTEVPPTSDWAGMAVDTNSRLGWRMRSDDKTRWDPQGPTIGRLVWRNGEPHIFFNPQEAFNNAARFYRTNIPAGQKHHSSWSSCWSEGMCSTEWSRQKNIDGSERITARYNVKGNAINGVPVPLRVLLGGYGEEDGVADTDEAE